MINTLSFRLQAFFRLKEGISDKVDVPFGLLPSVHSLLPFSRILYEFNHLCLCNISLNSAEHWFVCFKLVWMLSWAYYETCFFISYTFLRIIRIFFNVCLFLRERERGRHRIRSRLQVLSCQHRPPPRARTHKPQDHDLSRSRMRNRLSHPGAPRIVHIDWLAPVTSFPRQTSDPLFYITSRYGWMFALLTLFVKSNAEMNIFAHVSLHTCTRAFIEDVPGGRLPVVLTDALHTVTHVPY